MHILSAGGQLIHPDVEAMTMVPISPSRLTSCPIVIPASSEVEVLVHHWKDGGAIFSSDAKEEGTVVDGQRFHISVDPKPLTLLHPLHYDYYQTLQDKLGWETKSITERHQKNIST